MFIKNHIKKLTRSGKTLLIVRTGKNNITESALQVLASDKTTGLLPCEYTISSSVPSVQYEITGMVTLREFVSQGISQECFFSLLAQICSMLDFLKASGMYTENLVADSTKNVFVNPQSRSIYFIYRPFGIIKKYDNFYKFLTFMFNESDIHISDARNIQTYLKYLKEKCAQKSSASYMISSDEIRYAAGMYEASCDCDNSTTELLTEQTEDIGSGSPTLLSQEEPYLIDEAGRKIVIFKLPFIIGRTTARLAADLSYDGNFEISARHAEIRIENNKYVICDTNSKNGIFIGEKRILKETLSDNMKFMIHNIPLVFRSGTEIVKNDDTGSGTIQINGICPSYNNNGTLVLEEGGPCYRSYVEYVNAGEKYTIEKYPFVMGRDDPDYPAPDVDLKIKDNRTVSLRHAKIDVRIVDDTPKFFIYDIHSSNGTFLEGERIESEKAYELFSGCCFSLNKEDFRFYVDK